VAVTIDWRRARPAELFAFAAGVLLAVSLFLPWFEFGFRQEDAWTALTVTDIPAALAAIGGIALLPATLRQRSPAVPLAIAVWTSAIALVALALVAARAAAPPAGADERCFGLWLGLVGTLAVLAAAVGSLRDERPFWGQPVTR
jgi:hypothetical protein